MRECAEVFKTVCVDAAYYTFPSTQYLEGMFLKRQIGPGHPFHRKKLYVAAVNKDADAWYVEGETEEFNAIVYFGRKKRYGDKLMPQCEILPDRDAVLQRFPADHAEAMSKL